MKRRKLEIAILLFGAAFLVYLGFSFRPGHHPQRSSPAREALPTVAPAEEAGQATTVLKGFDYMEAVRGKPLFRIQSERTVGFGPGAGLVPNVYVLEKVALTVYPDRGAPVTIHSDRAQYDQRSKEAKLSGNVRWNDERGALGETNRLDFDPNKKVLTAPEPVHLIRGTFDLSAPSGRYDVGTRQMLLDGPVTGSGSGQETGGLTSLRADGAIYRKDESVIELTGSVSASGKAGDHLECDHLVFKMATEGGRAEWGRAEGHVRGIFVSAPVRGAASAAAGGQRRYSANAAALLFGPDGLARSLSLTGTPADVSDSRGRVLAETIDVAFQSGRATSAAARGHVHVETEKSRADSEQASLSLAPSGEIDTLELTGNVRMKGEDRSAQAEKAIDLPQRNVWILTSFNGSATVESQGSRVSANRIDVDENRHLLTAEGNARAIFVPQDSGPSGQPVHKPPTLVSDPKKPTYGKAHRVVLDDAAHVATLSGAATLWQDASSLSGDAITLNDVERSAVAVGNTRTVLLGSPGKPKPTPAPAKAGASEPSGPTVVTARRVTYHEKESKAVFEEDVTMTRGDERANADKAIAILGEDRKIEQVDLSGNVSLADPAQGRSGKADHATDWPREGKTILEGSPAWVIDAQGNRVTGAVLTITDQGRRVDVTAPTGGKTETIHRTKSS